MVDKGIVSHSVTYMVYIVTTKGTEVVLQEPGQDPK